MSEGKHFETTYEEIPIKELNFEAALNFFKEQALQHNSDEPVLMELYGWPNSGKTYFSHQLITAIHREGKNHAATFIHGTNEDDFREFETFRERYKEFKIPLLIIHNSSNTVMVVDRGVASKFKRFPEIAAFIYNSSRENFDAEAVEDSVRELIELRRKLSQEFLIPFSAPAVYIIKNPNAKEK